MMGSLKLVALSTVLALLTVGCGGGSSTTATAPATEGVNNQLASSVSIAGFDSLSLAQASQATGTTQTAMLPKLFDWVTNLIVPKAYAQTVQCNYDLLKLAGVDADGSLTQLSVLTSGDDCSAGFIDMYDGKRYIMFTASGIYKDGLTCNLVLLNKTTGGLFCVGERSRSIYKISGADSWKAYEKLQVSEDGNFMYLETDSSVFDENGQITGVKTKLLRFDLSNDESGPVASTLVEGFQQSWLSATGFAGNANEYEGFQIKGYQGLNNGDVALVYERFIASGSTWSNKLNAFYYAFNADGTYKRLRFDDQQINTLLTGAVNSYADPNSTWQSAGQVSWYDISCFFKTDDDDSFLFTIPYWYNYTYTDGNGNTQYNGGVAALLLKGTTPASGDTTMSVTEVTRNTAICSESSSIGGATISGSTSVRPHKVGDTYYALQSVSGYDATIGTWGQRLYLVGNKFDGTADTKQMVSGQTSWWGSNKLHSSKTYLYLQSAPDGSDWANYGPDSTKQPGDKLWRINPLDTLVLNQSGNLSSSSYVEVLDAQDSISISKIATSKLDDDLVLTGRDLEDADLKKIILDITLTGGVQKRPSTSAALQPVSIVKL